METLNETPVPTGTRDSRRTTGAPNPADRVYLSSPDLGAVEEEHLLRALRSGCVAAVGPDIASFERQLASRVGRAHAVAVSSGTAALHLALLAVGAAPGTCVVVPTVTFAATANAVTYTGAEPVLVDCDPATGNIDVPLLAELLGRLRGEGRRISAVVPVDVYGVCADYPALLPLCRAFGVPVVEDAAEALGSTAHGRHAGSFGDVGIFSFNGNKIMTTCGGGMVVTDDEALATRCRYLATQAREPVDHYEHTAVGYNYRLSNLLAALGLAQLSRLDEMADRRRALRDRYAKIFARSPGVTLLDEEGGGGNCWLTTIVVDPELAGWRASELAAHLARQNIETRQLWKPMHLQPVFAHCRTLLTGAAEALFERGLSLPSGSALSPAQVERVSAAIQEFLESR